MARPRMIAMLPAMVHIVGNAHDLAVSHEGVTDKQAMNMIC